MADMFEGDCQALVNTVNTVGVMGGGLALQFRLRYPKMNTWYEALCHHGHVKVGEIMFYTEDDGRIVVNFPTKDHYKDPSELIWVEDGLIALRRELLIRRNIASIAIPPLGCGLGGLRWENVEPLIHRHLSDLPTRVVVYAPGGDVYELDQQIHLPRIKSVQTAAN